MTPARNLSDDLSYIRDLAEAGQNAPLLAGRFLALWGGLVSAAYLGHFLIATGAFGLPPSTYMVIWIGFAVIGGTGQFVLSRGAREKPGQSSVGNRVQAVLWTTAGFFMFAYFASLIIRMVTMGSGIEGFYWSVPMVLGLYGIGQFVTGAISGHKALKFAGLAAFAGVVAAVFLTGTEYIWLVGSASAFLAVFVPGLIMMRSEPSETV
ncbi:hypothetical protein [Hyphomonas sp.]|uniref:hypothetical protein n=1 Tax=Hyphomonas sp. TaxID=87 RepID=UPI00391CF15A